MNLNIHINIGIKDLLPKYACRNCGSDEVRGDFDTYPVFRAEGDNLVHLRSESAGGSVLTLYCNECQEPIEAEVMSDIAIE